MTATVYQCGDRRNRLDKINETAGLNGIDFVEVSRDLVEVHFLKDLDQEISWWSTRVKVDGGVRFTPPPFNVDEVNGKVLTLKINGNTDYSTYTLRLVSSRVDDTPPPGFDTIASAIDFSFKAWCPSDFDCRTEHACPVQIGEPPALDYLAKDYESFRRLMMDRLSQTLGHNFESNAADWGVAVVEVLAYAADYLSYYQDAVATEAYLGTCRRRSSARRHARLLDYHVNDGRNARTWVHFRVDEVGVYVPKGTRLVSRHDASPVLDDRAFEAARQDGHLVFETMHDAMLDERLNELEFHTWYQERCCLTEGSTEATVKVPGANSGHVLKAGMALVLEEIRSPYNGGTADARPERRHVVRLTSVVPTSDPLDVDPNWTLCQVAWASEDALPFSLDLSPSEGEDGPMAVARGNMVLADHGLTVGEDLTSAQLTADGRFKLDRGPVAMQVRATGRRVLRDEDNRPLLFNPRGSAHTAMGYAETLTLPSIRLKNEEDIWLPQPDLLGSASSSREFVVESDTDGVFLRFGDGLRGKRRPASATAIYRIGNGVSGNLGPDSLTHVVGPFSNIQAVRNPVPAVGGVEPESLTAIRLSAPYAFKTQERAVTEADYAAVAQRHPEVERAVAFREWTGSWYAVNLLIDRRGGKRLDEAFISELGRFVDRYRMAGYDLEIAAPDFVPLEIVMTVCVEGNVFKAHVRKALTAAFSSRPGGFFHADNFTFGQSVYLSAIVERALRVPGVRWVDLDDREGSPNRFRRFGRERDGEFDAGEITIAKREIARLDNDRNFPEHGQIDFLMEGGS